MLAKIKISRPRGTSDGVHVACKVQKILAIRPGISAIYFLLHSFPRRDSRYTLLLIDASAIRDKNRERGLNQRTLCCSMLSRKIASKNIRGLRDNAIP